jgi:hypothetical protein
MTSALRCTASLAAVTCAVLALTACDDSVGPPPAAPVASYTAPPAQAAAPVTPGPIAALAVGNGTPMTTPTLGPLLGTQMWQQEISAVLDEQRSNLSPDNAARVKGIPFVVDNKPNEINAYAGCDKNGSPFIVGTEGILEAIDAISQTVATDDLYGTQTYAAYSAQVIPSLAHDKNARAALPLGLIPLQYLAQPARISHAHELYDEIAAFTFGHEMAHHYLGHTGCAHGQPVPLMNATVINGVIGAVPSFTQPFELAADNQGVINTLDSGRARAARGQYRWTERGASLLLDFFGKLEKAAGLATLNPVTYVQTHPPAAQRIFWVQTAANTWRLTHPG